MKTGIAACLFALTLAAVCRSAAAFAGSKDDLDLWKDPAFRRKFMGTYGVNSEIEPKVTMIEKETMEKVMGLMGSEKGMKRARSFLEANTGKGSSAVLDFTIANLYFQLDELEPAAEWYEKAVEKFPSFQRALKNLGMVYVRLGKFDKASGPLTRAIELGAVDAVTFGLLGYSYLTEERYVSAACAYRRAMMLQPGITDWKLGLARCLFKQNKCAEAAGICAELIKNDPNRPEYWLLQANAYLGMGKPLKAAANYEYLDVAGRSTTRSLNTLGDIYVNEKCMDLACSAYVRAMKKDKKGKAGEYFRNAEVLAARAAYNEARTLMTEIRRRFDGLDKNEEKRMLKLEARLAAASGKGGDKQAEVLEKIVALDPLDGDALITLADLYAAAGKAEKAEFLYERAQGIESYEARALLRHAQCLVKNEKYSKALPKLKRAQDLDPRDDVASYIKQVERIARMQ